MLWLASSAIKLVKQSLGSLELLVIVVKSILGSVIALSSSILELRSVLEHISAGISIAVLRLINFLLQVMRASNVILKDLVFDFLKSLLSLVNLLLSWNILSICIWLTILIELAKKIISFLQRILISRDVSIILAVSTLLCRCILKLGRVFELIFVFLCSAVFLKLFGFFLKSVNFGRKGFIDSFLCLLQGFQSRLNISISWLLINLSIRIWVIHLVDEFLRGLELLVVSFQLLSCGIIFLGILFRLSLCLFKRVLVRNRLFKLRSYRLALCVLIADFVRKRSYISLIILCNIILSFL